MRWIQTILLGLLAVSFGFGAEPEAGWGMNARISGLGETDLNHRLDLLQAAGVKWLREDLRVAEPAYSLQVHNMDEARKRGFHFLALIPYGIGKPPLNPEDHLFEDLTEVYGKAKKWAEENRDRVDAWELYNEADTGFCRDLPDRSTAYMKAVYLGLKAGGLPGKTPVIMGALALPPGPWLNRAARNGLLDYADAYNFHYYGHERDFADVIQANRNFLKYRSNLESIGSPSLESLPLWITECGYAISSKEGERERQSAYLLENARTARERGMASFMPYAMSASRGFSLLSPTGQPLPAWDAFSKYASEHRLSSPPAFVASAQSGPVILQWLPGRSQAIPHKTSGSYRFLPAGPEESLLTMRGEVRIYNFGEEMVKGNLRWSGLRSVHPAWGSELSASIPPGGMVSIPVALTAPPRGYFQEWCEIDFEMENGAWKHSENVRQTRLFFGLEAFPVRRDFSERELSFLPFSTDRSFQYIDPEEGYRISSRSDSWLGLNGLKMVPGEKGIWKLFFEEGSAGGSPPMAVARVKGLPAGAFLRLRANQILDKDFSFRVDLVDGKGQRFTIFENSGMSYFTRQQDVWLNLRDFHLYFWGRCLNPRFDPAAVREIQIRPYVKDRTAEIELKIDLMLPKHPPAP